MRCKANNRIYLQIYGVIIPLFMGLNGFGFAGVFRRKGEAIKEEGEGGRRRITLADLVEILQGRV